MRLLFTLPLFLFFSSIVAQSETFKADWTSYSQSIDVSEWEESDFIVSAYLKKSENNSNGTSALWVRVDKQDNTTGFFKNDYYDKNKKVSSKWKKFDIKGKVDSGAEKLYFGAFCRGNGSFYFDKFEVKIKTKSGKWKKMKIINNSFEEVESNDTWDEGIGKRMFNIENYDISYSKEASYDGKKSLNIKGENIIGYNDIGKFVDVNNVKLYYEVYGEGEPLLMLHGNSQWMSSFMYQVEDFFKSYKVILVDRRGRGESTFDSNTELTYSLEANDINLFLEKIGIKKAHILGWGDGGIIGLIMAINFPEKVDKLITVGANINPNGLKNLEELFNSIEELKNNKEKKNDRLIALYKLMALYPKLDYADLKAIKSKTLIMAGDQDNIKNIHTIKMYEAIENAQLAILPNETHYFPVDNPESFNKLVMEFLKE